MILGYEEPVQMPTMDIYSTDLMKMYIEGVKEQYKEGLEEYKDFMKQYQDFYSSLPGANEYWYNNTIKPAQDLIAQAAAQGVDLFKSPEGRAAIRNMINGVPLGKLKQVQAASDDYDKYLDSVAKLQEQNKYNPAFQDFILSQMYPGGYQLVDKNGNINPWKTRSATPYEDMTTYTAPWFEGMKDSFIGQTPDGKYDLVGIDDDAMKPILDQNMADYLGSPLGQFHFQQFASTLPPDTTPEEAFSRFQDEILAKNRRIQHVEREADPYAKDDHSTANDIRANAAKAATDWHYKQKEWYLENPWADPNSDLYYKNPSSPYYTGNNQIPGKQKFRGNNTQSTVKEGYSHFLQNDYTEEELISRISGARWIKDGSLPGGGQYGIPDENGSIKGQSGTSYRPVDAYEMQKRALQRGDGFKPIEFTEAVETLEAINDMYFYEDDNKAVKIRPQFFDNLVPGIAAYNRTYGTKNIENKDELNKQKSVINDLKNEKLNIKDMKFMGKSFVVLDSNRKTKSAYTRIRVTDKENKNHTVLFRYAYYKRGENGEWIPDVAKGDQVWSLDKAISDKMFNNGVKRTNTETGGE